jgi:L-fuculose-phosphate aldolase
LMMARDLGKVHYFTEGETRELLNLKQKWGFKDARLHPEMENCDICANDVFRHSWKSSGVEQRAFEPPPAMKKSSSSTPASAAAAGGNIDQEALVKLITDRVMESLAAKS